MSSGEVRKVSPQDLQLVQNLIERCLQLYMNQKEVVSMLLHQAKIEPSFTELVWQKLEEENQEFFKAYHLRLILKDQILKFNKLLETQAELMQQISPIPVSNGSHVPLNHTGQGIKPENMHQSTVANLANSFTNGGSLVPSMQSAIDMSGQSGRNNVSPNLLLPQSSNVGIVQGMNDGGMTKPEASYAGEPSFMYGVDRNGLERRPAIAEAPVSAFIGEESNSKPLGEPIFDVDTSSFGFLGQIPRNFSLSDLTADFSVSSDILDSYSRSPFLATDTDNFLNSHGNGDLQGDGKRLETISEGLSYEGFGSD